LCCGAPLGSNGKADSLAAIESVKTAGDVYAPVDCEVIEVNSKLSTQPELVNKSPTGEGTVVVCTARAPPRPPPRTSRL
jgi:glycine cleavage system H protein